MIFLPNLQKKKKKLRRSSVHPRRPTKRKTYKIEMPTTHLLRNQPSGNLKTHPPRLRELAPGVGWGGSETVRSPKVRE